MKINVNEAAARVLRDRLKDEQPGSELHNVLRQLDVSVDRSDLLTADELNTVLAAVVEFELHLLACGNRTDFQQRQVRHVGTAIPKLTTMRDRQQAREKGQES